MHLDAAPASSLSTAGILDHQMDHDGLCCHGVLVACCPLGCADARAEWAFQTNPPAPPDDDFWSKLGYPMEEHEAP